MAVAAADHQTEVGRLQLRMGDVVGGDVSRQMVYRHKGLSGGERQPLGKIHPHQQCADESGVRRHGNTV